MQPRIPALFDSEGKHNDDDDGIEMNTRKVFLVISACESHGTSAIIWYCRLVGGNGHFCPTANLMGGLKNVFFMAGKS